MQRTHYDSDHEDYRGTVREFLAREVEPHFLQWEEDRLIDRASYVAAASTPTGEASSRTSWVGTSEV